MDSVSRSLVILVGGQKQPSINPDEGKSGQSEKGLNLDRSNEEQESDVKITNEGDDKTDYDEHRRASCRGRWTAGSCPAVNARPCLAVIPRLSTIRSYVDSPAGVLVLKQYLQLN
ncbi:unnamed protein product [Amaranthus hypochondriacus]